MKYYFFSYDADTFPVAYKLLQEHEEVTVCQIQDGKELGTDSWINEKEEPEQRRRRLSLYDGMLEKLTLEQTYKKLQGENPVDTFVIVGHNALCAVSEKVLSMGFTGLLPTKEDFDREKERQKSKDFVKRHYPDLHVDDTKEFKGVDKVLDFINNDNNIWVVKSDGNFGETVVPDTDDLEMARMEIESELKQSEAEYNKGKLVLERKIRNVVEIAPQAVWWDGELVYTCLSLETRMLGPADRGPQTGGNQDLIFQTEPDAKINKIAFPPAVHDIARRRKGMFMMDAGILADGNKLFFSEYAGCRFGWGSIFTEMSVSMNRERDIAGYWESIRAGEPPYNYIFGASLAVYNLTADSEFPMLRKDGVPINVKNSSRDDFFIMQCRMEKDRLVSVGYRDFNESPLGYVTGRGDIAETAISNIYQSLRGISLKGMYFRSEEDFKSVAYSSAIMDRLKYLEGRKLI